MVEKRETVGVRPCEEKDFESFPEGWSGIGENKGSSVYYCLNQTEAVEMTVQNYGDRRNPKKP